LVNIEDREKEKVEKSITIDDENKYEKYEKQAGKHDIRQISSSKILLPSMSHSQSLANNSINNSSNSKIVRKRNDKTSDSTIDDVIHSGINKIEEEIQTRRDRNDRDDEQFKPKM